MMAGPDASAKTQEATSGSTSRVLLEVMTGEMPVANEMDQEGALKRMALMAEAVQRGLELERLSKAHEIFIDGARNTPTVSGALKRSLTRPGDRAHRFKLADKFTIEYGTELDYGYHGRKVYKVDADALVEAVAAALLAPLLEG